MKRAVRITADCEERLAALIRQRTGVRLLDHQLDNLRDTISNACATFDYPDCSDYLLAIEGSNAESRLQEHLIAGITVGESYFFRDRQQMGFLQEHFLPELIRQRRQSGNRYLRIWSAGCSAGQEVYSILIMLHQLIDDIDQWNIHLLGTDINVSALSMAIRGKYDQWSFRATSDLLRQRFFTPVNGRWQLNSALRRAVKFSYLNLYGDSFPSVLSETNALDLILCRNVFIYFDREIVPPVMEKFYASLMPGGCLLMGASDLLDEHAAEAFEYHTHGNMHYLRKSEVPLYPALLPSSPEVDSLEDKVAEKVAVVELPEAAPPDLSPVAAIKPYEEIIALLGGDAWDAVVRLIDKRIEQGDDSALIWQFRGKALANKGLIDEALLACECSIERDPTDKHSHFIRALLLIDAHRQKAAEAALRATLYLDRRFVEAHYQLGLLLMRRGEKVAGIKSLRNALQIAESEQPERQLHDAAGMSHGRIASILRNELLIYEGKDNSSLWGKG